MRWIPSRRAWPVLTAVTLLLAMASAPVASGTEPTPTTYQGHWYGNSTSNPTEDKPQSKLWYADGSWWALMLDPSDERIHVYELMPDHTWRSTATVVDDRPSSTGDALWDGSKLYVASRQSSSALRVSRLSYDPTFRTWLVDAGFPIAVTSGGSESATIDKDSVGRLWVTYTKSKRVWVAHSTTNDLTWTPPFNPPVPDTRIDPDDLSALVAFNGRIGVMWSDQESGAFRFAVHVDGAPDSEWSFESPIQGMGVADDHVNLKSVAEDPSGRVFAVVKTAGGGSPDAPLIVVLQRSVTGEWTSHTAGRVVDDHTRPVILIDATNQRLLVFATAPETYGVIYMKSSPLSSISFAPGLGEPFVAMKSKYLNNATATKQPVTARTGVVVLASSSSTDRRYYHAEMPIIAPEEGDTQAPSTPTGVVAEAMTPSSVELSWQPATDEVGVAGYTVYRDGASVGRVTGTSFVDINLHANSTYTYTVTASDSSGNVSAPSEPVTVTTPEAPPSQGIVFQGATSGANTTATTLSMAAPPGGAGDVMVTSVSVRGRPAITPPPGWATVRIDDNGTVMRQAVFLRVRSATEPAEYTWTFSSSQAAAGSVVAYAGVDTVSPVEASVGQINASSTNIATPTTATETTASLALGVFGLATYAEIGSPTSLTERAEAGTPATLYKVTTATGDQIVAAPGTVGPFVAVATKAAVSVGQVVVLRPAP